MGPEVALKWYFRGASKPPSGPLQPASGTLQHMYRGLNLVWSPLQPPSQPGAEVSSAQVTIVPKQS